MTSITGHTTVVRFLAISSRSGSSQPAGRRAIMMSSATGQKAVIRILQKLHKSRDTSPFLSYYTSMGRIFIRLADPAKNKKVKTIELSVGTTEKDILEICQRHNPKTSVPTKASHTSSRKTPHTTPGGARVELRGPHTRVEAGGKDIPNQTVHHNHDAQGSREIPRTVQPNPKLPQPAPVVVEKGDQRDGSKENILQAAAATPPGSGSPPSQDPPADSPMAPDVPHNSGAELSAESNNSHDEPESKADE